MKMYARFVLTLMTAACPWPLLAQTAPAPATATAAAPAAPAPTTAQVNAASTNTDQTFVLSPFEVSSSTDHGYETNATLAGTRIRTNLDDVAASISVMNKAFLTDIGALDSGTLLQYTTNAEVTGTEGTYAGVGNSQTFSEQSNLLNPSNSNRIRGLAAADNTRDYYITDIPWDSYNVDRIDILRGPNSFLYGLGSPAGIVNASLNNAEFRDFGNATLRFGSYGSTRSTVDLNQDLIHNVLAIRIDGMYDNRKYEQSDAYQNQKRIYAAFRFDPNLFGSHSSFHTSLKGKIESGDISADRPRILPPNDSITPFFRSTAISASNPFGGMGGQYQNNPYDPWRTDGVVPGNGRGTLESNTVNFQPWLGDGVNQQQPFWLINGSNGQTLAVNGGYINVGAIQSNGTAGNASTGIQGKGTNMQFPELGSLSGAALAYNLPGAIFGQYKTQSLEDPSVFNFYDHLIDGPSKSEWERWTASNIDLTETAFDDRLGLDVSYDRQNYYRGGQALLGYSPTLNIDINRNNLDYYLNGGDGETTNTNANVGRPFVAGAGGNGGSSYKSTRQVQRASLFGELRATDFIRNDFWAKLVGTHRFNIVASNEQFWDENLVWQEYANSLAWDAYWNGNNGLSNGITGRQPTAFIYLGPSLMGKGSASNAHIPGITSNVQLQGHGVYVFDSTYNSNAPAFNSPWNVPSNLFPIYEGTPNPQNPTNQLTQASNPSNYTGWNSNFQDNLLQSNDGSNPMLWTTAEQSFRETLSYAGNYQAYLWKNAIVGTLGWRYDEVETKDITVPHVVTNRNELDLTQFNLPQSFPLGQIFKNHSTSEGIVVHLNDFIPHDPLPINVSLTYNNSNNFQVTSVRRDVYGNPIDNPIGKTKEEGIILSTKDDRLSLRIVKYDTKVANGSSTLSNAGGIGTTIGQGLRYRNVFLYQLGVYTIDTENQPAGRNNWQQAYPSLTVAQAAQQEDQAIDTWNAIQKHLATLGFFQAWNFTPTTPSVLVNRTTYLTNPSAFQPDPSTVSAYGPTLPQGFTVTADTESKGYEFDLTANPTRHWRMEFNASQDTATQTNVGGPALQSLVTYLESQLQNADGTPSPAALMPQFGNASLDIQNNVWGPWLQSYTLLKLQEGSEVSELRKWRFNWINNYDFTEGALRGWGVGGAWRWQDKDVIGYPVNAVTNAFVLSQPYYGPPESSVDAWVSYSRKLTNKIGWKIQLNVTNLLARNGLIPVSIEPDGNTWAAVRVKPIQEWALTNTFNF